MKSVIASALATIALQVSLPSLPPPFPREGISKVFENDRVVVWQGVLGIRGEPTAMHRHEFDLVGVFLDDGQVRTQLPDGTVRDGSPFRRGAAVFQPRGVVHTEEVLVDGTRAVGIELKLVDRSQSETNDTSLVTASGDDGRVILDNDRVVVREYVWGNSQVARDSQRRDAFIVPVGSGQVRQTDRDGTTRIERLVFGQVMFRPRDQRHIEVAVAGTPRAIVVELK